MAALLSRDPWWYPKEVNGTERVEWGYLYTYSDGTYVFSPNETPTDNEIEASTSYIPVLIYNKIIKGDL